MSEPTGFLYPFIEEEERDLGALQGDLVQSASAKIELSHSLRAETVRACAPVIRAAGEAMAERFDHGGRLFFMGNGGSATDAQGGARLFNHPPQGRPLPAVSLVDDPAILTALANDIGFDLVFARQVAAYGKDGDMVVGFSTSGESANLLRAFEEAERRQLLTVGLAGYSGGAMAGNPAVAHLLVVRSDSVHRIQEAQSALIRELWATVQHHLGQTGRP